MDWAEAGIWRGQRVVGRGEGDGGRDDEGDGEGDGEGDCGRDGGRDGGGDCALYTLFASSCLCPPMLTK